jgi:hypothetical protein
MQKEMKFVIIVSHQHVLLLQSFVDPGRKGVTARSSRNGGAARTVAHAAGGIARPTFASTAPLLTSKREP